MPYVFFNASSPIASARARSTAARAASGAVPAAKLAICPRGLRRTLKLPGGGS